MSYKENKICTNDFNEGIQPPNNQEAANKYQFQIQTAAIVFTQWNIPKKKFYSTEIMIVNALRNKLHI